MTDEPKQQPMPITYEIAATLKYGVSIDGFTGTSEEAITDQAIAQIMKATGATRENIMSISIRSRPRKLSIDIDALKKLPLWRDTPQNEEIAFKKVRRMVHEDGRNARAIGLPEDHALSRMIDEELNACWLAGWRAKDQELKGWRDPATGLPTELGVKNGL